jgi:hypothetical protein
MTCLQFVDVVQQAHECIVSQALFLGTGFTNAETILHCRLVDRTRFPFHFMAVVDAEDGLVAVVCSVGAAWAMFAVSTLAFFGDRREHLRRIHLAEFLEYERICDGLFEHRKDGRIDIANDNATAIASERHLIAVLFGHEEVIAVHASFSVTHDGKGAGSRRRFYDSPPSAPFYRLLAFTCVQAGSRSIS